MINFIDWVLNNNFRSFGGAGKFGLACKTENMSGHSKRSGFLA
jgi:hypothetical protein